MLTKGSSMERYNIFTAYRFLTGTMPPDESNQFDRKTLEGWWEGRRNIIDRVHELTKYSDALGEFGEDGEWVRKKPTEWKWSEPTEVKHICNQFELNNLIDKLEIKGLPTTNCGDEKTPMVVVDYDQWRVSQGWGIVVNGKFVWEEKYRHNPTPPEQSAKKARPPLKPAPTAD